MVEAVGDVVVACCRGSSRCLRKIVSRREAESLLGENPIATSRRWRAEAARRLIHALRDAHARDDDALELGFQASPAAKTSAALTAAGRARWACGAALMWAREP